MQVTEFKMFVSLVVQDDDTVKIHFLRAKRPHGLRSTRDLTDVKRREFFNVEHMGGANSGLCEKHQRNMIELGTGHPCPKTRNVRINTETLEMKSCPQNVYTSTVERKGSYDWTESFDGVQHIDGTCTWYNLKSITGAGGNQIRSMKCVYEMVKAQRELINRNKVDSNVFFVNILDGKYGCENTDKFDHLVGDDSRIYVGELFNYFEWFNSRLENML